VNEGLNNCFQTDGPDTYIWARPNEDGVRPLASYANHSCQPNVVVLNWTVPGSPRRHVVFKTLKDISKGEEIFNSVMDESWGIQCLCRDPPHIPKVARPDLE